VLAPSQDPPRELSERFAIEERLSRAKAAWRRARAELDGIEEKLGQRALDVEERIARRARMHPWARTALDWLGALPGHEDDQRWLSTKSEIENQKQAVAAVERELEALRKLERELDEPLARLGAELDRARGYVEQLEAAYEVGAAAEGRAKAAVVLLHEAEASSQEEGKGDDEGVKYSETSKLLNEAGTALTQASANFSLCNETTLAGVLLDVGSRASAAGMWQPAAGQHDTRVIEALRSSTTSALDVAGAFLMRLGGELERARAVLGGLRDQRTARLEALGRPAPE